MVAPWPDEDFACPTCRISYPALPVADSLVLVRGVPGALELLCSDLGDATLRERPAAGSWSILEYLYHIRDVYSAYTIRLHLARTEESPILEPLLNDVRAERLGYNALDARPALGEIRWGVSGLCDEVSAFGPGELARTVRRGQGEIRTALWLVRQAAHEGIHHREDIRALISSAVARG
jgi:hypothetical protein